MKHKAILVWIAVFALAFFFSLNVVHAQPPPPVPELPKVTPPKIPDLADLTVMVSVPGAYSGDILDLYPHNPEMGQDRLYYVRGMVFNRGRVAVPGGRCEVDIFLSKDRKVSSDDILIGTIVITEAIPPLPPGRFDGVSLPRRDHSIIGVPPGIYYICARVDPRHRIRESDETNNDYCHSGGIRIHEAKSAK